MTNEEVIQRLREGLSCYGERCLSCPDRKHCVTHYEHEAADAIESLQLFVDLYQHLLDENEKILKEVINKYPKWISVNERLPDIGKSIIFATKSGYAAEGEYIGDCWVQYRWTTKVKNEAVIHWMPLPEPPKEKT